MLRDAERQILRDTIAYCDGNQAEAARVLGVKPTLITTRGQLLGGIFEGDPRHEPMKDPNEKRSDSDPSGEVVDDDSDQSTDDGDGEADHDDAAEDESADSDHQR